MLDADDFEQAAANLYVKELIGMDLSPSDSISSYEQHLLFGAIVEICGQKAIAMGVSPKHAFSIVQLVAKTCFALVFPDRVNQFVLPVIPTPSGE